MVAKAKTITPIRQKRRKSKSDLKEEIEEKLLMLMNQSLDKMLSAKTPQEEEDLKQSLEFFRQLRIHIHRISIGSVILTLICKTRTSLDAFWDAYCSGALRDMFQHDYITEELLMEFELESVELDIFVEERDISTCREELTGK